jgi:hypothetical protein
MKGSCTLSKKLKLTQWQHVTSTAVLVLAALGDLTQMRSFLSLSHCPRLPSQVQYTLPGRWKALVHSQNFMWNLYKRQHLTNSTLLELATLGDLTQMSLFLSVLHCPRWPSQVQHCLPCQWKALVHSQFFVKLIQWQHAANSICHVVQGGKASRILSVACHSRQQF